MLGRPKVTTIVGEMLISQPTERKSFRLSVSRFPREIVTKWLRWDNPIVERRAPLTWIENRYLKRYFHGRGIEIGALWRRFPVPRRARVWYLDRLGGAGLESHYPELRGRILQPDLLGDATELPVARPA